MTRTARWIPILLAAILFLGWRTYRAWTESVLPGEAAPRGESVLPGGPAYPEPAGGADTAAYAVSVIQSRPLFRPDRSPYSESGAAVPGRNYEAELSRFTILGVLFLDGERKAIVSDRNSAGSGSREVGAGDTLEGFTVKEVEADGMVMEADGRSFTLPLYGGAPKGGGAAPARPGSPPRAVDPRTPATPAVSQGTPPVPPGVPAPAPRQPTRPRRYYVPGRR